jgi:hypothetical protein
MHAAAADRTRTDEKRLGYFARALRSIEAVSSVNRFATVPVGTRNENVHEKEGELPTSENDCAVL